MANKELIRVLSSGAEHWVGNGFYVSTIFSPQPHLNSVLSPFLLMDHAAPREFPPTTDKLGVGEHPHRGFETVTFAIQGEVDHRDSAGGGGRIGTGGVQWMTAGAGLVHEEFHSTSFAKTGGVFEMVQLWVNLPKKDKMTSPRYQSIAVSDIPVIDFQGIKARVVAGELQGVQGPAMTFTPIQVFDLQVGEEKKISLPISRGHSLLLFVLSGAIKVSEQELKTRDLGIFTLPGDGVEFFAKTGSRVLVLSGEPIDEPIVAWGPFVMNDAGEICRATQDFQEGKMGTLVEEAEKKG